MKHYKVLKKCQGPWQNLQRLAGQPHQPGDIILAGELDGKVNCKAGNWKEATKTEIEKAKK